MTSSTMCFLLVLGVAVLEIWPRRRRITSFGVVRAIGDKGEEEGVLKKGF
jgi:hypothetical protein